MKIYLAGRYGRREELCTYAEDLRAIGHSVDASWLLGDSQAHTGAAEVEAAEISTPMVAGPFALDDYNDVWVADMLIAFSETARSAFSSRGGRHVEFGMALATRKKMIVVGPRENIFHTLPWVQQFWQWSDALHHIITTYVAVQGRSCEACDKRLGSNTAAYCCYLLRCDACHHEHMILSHSTVTRSV